MTLATPRPAAPAALSFARPTRADCTGLLALSAPIVAVQFGMMAMGVVAVMLVGHVSDVALGGVALGNLYSILLVLLAWGVLMALDPLVAQAAGARDPEALALALQRGLLLAAGLAVASSLACLPVRAVLLALGQPAVVAAAAEPYVWLSIPGLPPLLVFILLRQTLQAMGRTREIVTVTLVANVVHLALCWALVFGRLGLPAMGVAGAAIAATVTRWLMTAGLLAATWPLLGPALAPRRRALDRAALGHMLRIGLPIGIQMQLEYGIFAVVGVFMGWLGMVPLDAHQVALQVASCTFMVPQGIGAAAAALVGQAVGARDEARARRVTVAALCGSAAFMALSGLALWLAAHPIAAVFSMDAAVVAGSALLLPIAGAFQVFDGLQVVAIGALRGVGDTRTPVAINLLGYWLVGLPVSLLLGFGLRAGATGLWWGLVAGMAVVALVLLVRLRVRLARPLARLRLRENAAG